MHTTQSGNTTFIHNGDYSGEVEIIRSDPAGKTTRIIVPFRDLVAIVASAVRQARTTAIEAMNDADLLGIDPDALRDG